MSELPELTQDQKKLQYLIEQWRDAALRDAEKLHADRRADIDNDYRYRMVDAGLGAKLEADKQRERDDLNARYGGDEIARLESALADAQAMIAELAAALEAIARQRVDAPRDIPATDWGKGYASAMIKYTSMARDALNRIDSADAGE